MLGLWAAAAGVLFAENAVKANDTQKRIVILGDSITAGYGLDPRESYPAVLQKKIDQAKLPFVVANAGVSGDTSAGGLRRVAWAMTKGADILVIALGGNDGLRGISPAETKKNLLGIISKARTRNPKIQIFIAGMQMPDNMGPEFTERFKTLFPAVAKESKSTLIPFLIEGVGGDERLNQADGIHPTAEGQKIIAENVWKILQPKLIK
ncbi:arylesterase [Akkermansiaceae bacterium]|nr:arylesterase [bacterium]MDA7930150.1 arylesterase [Akkermansiaceae bacterium]MDA7933595.1 arylesterase [Akkermansiaceae bacterium]